MSKLTKSQLKQLVLEEFSKHKKLKDLQEKKKKIEESIKSIEESEGGETKEADLEEKHLSRAEQKAKESEVKKLKGNPRAVDSFKSQYGSDWKNVMYGKSTNDAKNES